MGTVISGQIGFVPYFPILDIKLKTVCPALIVMTDNMLADDCPFPEVLWGMDAVFFYFVLDSVSESVKHLCVCQIAALNVLIGERKIIIFGISGICIEIGENIVNVDHMLLPVAVIEGRIVGSRIRNTRVFEFIQIVVEGMQGPVFNVFELNRRTVIYRVHRLDLTERFFKIYT